MQRTGPTDARRRRKRRRAGHMRRKRRRRRRADGCVCSTFLPLCRCTTFTPKPSYDCSPCHMRRSALDGGEGACSLEKEEEEILLPFMPHARETTSHMLVGAWKQKNASFVEKRGISLRWRISSWCCNRTCSLVYGTLLALFPFVNIWRRKRGGKKWARKCKEAVYMR